jgi:hypothetical protein
MYLEIDEGFQGHRKTLRLCSLLKNPEAGWYMIRLWTWACRSCQSGSLAGITGDEIEIIVQYRPQDGECYRAMVAAGFIDVDAQGPMGLHGWMERTGSAINRMAKHAAGMRASRERKNASPSTHVLVTCSSREAHVTTSPVQSSPDKTRQDPEKITVCPETPEAGRSTPAIPSSPTVFTYPCDGKTHTWVLTEAQIDEWRKLFPSLDVMGESSKALAWIQANQTKRKTARGMPAFLVGWFGRSQNRCPSLPFQVPQRDPRVGSARADAYEHAMTGDIPV